MNHITVESVREALLCLYAPEELAQGALAQVLPDAIEAADDLQRAQAVRGALLDAVEMLRLPTHTGHSASASRAYDCVRLRYLSGFDVDSVAQQLAVGRRQVYRDLQTAEECLARLLQGHSFFAESPPPPAQAVGVDFLSEEIHSLTRKAEAVDLTSALQAAIALVTPLARGKGVRISLEGPGEPVSVLVPTAILRQAITLVLSAIIQSEPNEGVVVRLRVEPRRALVTLPLPDESRLTRLELVRVAADLAAAQNWDWEMRGGEGARQLTVGLPLAKRRRVLIVEDNPGTQALFGRYLAESEWEPVAVPSPRLTVELAAREQVEAVILDIMMSESDGWTLLQHLKLSPRTEAIPVIMCSVLNDPDLGRALGASAYLVKPVSRVDLVRTLRQVAPASRSEAGEPYSSE